MACARLEEDEYEETGAIGGWWVGNPPYSWQKELHNFIFMIYSEYHKEKRFSILIYGTNKDGEIKWLDFSQIVLSYVAFLIFS